MLNRIGSDFVNTGSRRVTPKTGLRYLYIHGKFSFILANYCTRDNEATKFTLVGNQISGMSKVDMYS